jgi:hypothetical protein
MPQARAPRNRHCRNLGSTRLRIHAFVPLRASWTNTTITPTQQERIRSKTSTFLDALGHKKCAATRCSVCSFIRGYCGEFAGCRRLSSIRCQAEGCPTNNIPRHWPSHKYLDLPNLDQPVVISHWNASKTSRAVHLSLLTTPQHYQTSSTRYAFRVSTYSRCYVLLYSLNNRQTTRSCHAHALSLPCSVYLLITALVADHRSRP